MLKTSILMLFKVNLINLYLFYCEY